MKTVVLGSGGWGTALSLVLHRNGHPVTLWSHVPEKAAYMERARENPRLEGVPLPPELRLTADMACLTEAELVVVAVPSYAVRETAHAAAPLLRPGTLLVTAAKGIERDTHLRMSQILEQETGGAFPIAALSGPSHAEEVARGVTLLSRTPTGTPSLPEATDTPEAPAGEDAKADTGDGSKSGNDDGGAEPGKADATSAPDTSDKADDRA